MSENLSPQSPGNTLGALGETYLSERAVTAATAQEHGIEIDSKPTSERFRERLGFDVLMQAELTGLAKEVIWFPCADITGRTVSWIARLLPAIGSAKFINAKGDAMPFIPHQTWETASKSHKPLVITEGPVKALALAQVGQLPIGVSGVWMATQKGSNQYIELVPALAGFEWRGRIVYLAFDADSETNPNVKQALFRTFLALYRQGAKVRFLKWLPSEGKGIDDYLQGKQAVGEERLGALAKLLDDAQEVSSLLVAEDLAMVQNELAVANLNRSQTSQITRLVSAPLKVRASALEKDFINSGAEPTAKTFELTDPEPFPDPVNGAALLREIVDLVRWYVVMSEAQAVAVALWVFLTYLETQVDVLPILAITSPQKRCGKTTLLSILRRLVRKPLVASSVTAAALFRSVEKWTPTLLIDEADTFLKDNAELRGILNAGHTRDLAFVLRTNNDSLEPERFSTWCPKAVACIGSLPETLADRSVNIRLERRTPKERVARLRDADPQLFKRLAQQLMRWALDQGEKVRNARPLIPSILNDRASDNWQSFLAIAMTVGDNWLELASKAALDLHTADDSEESLSIAVLLALREILGPSVEFLPTDELIGTLNADKEAPWADWKAGITAERLGRILKAFGIKSKRRQTGGDRHRGYSREALKQVFDRYLGACSPAPIEPDEPGHSSAKALPEPIRAGQVQQTQLGPGQAQNSNPATAEPLPELIPVQVAKIDVENAGVGRIRDGETINGVNLTAKDARTVRFAAELFDGQIVGSDETEAEPPQLPLASPPPKPDLSTLRNGLSVLAPHDYEGGLSYRAWRLLARVPDEEFDETLKTLCRRVARFTKAS